MKTFIITITTQLETLNISGINENVLYHVIKAYYNRDSELKLGGKTYQISRVHEIVIHQFNNKELFVEFMQFVIKNNLLKKNITGSNYFEKKIIEQFAKEVTLDYLTIEREEDFKKDKSKEETSEENQEILDGINELIERLSKLELGQEIIYEDLRKDIEEVKDLIGKTSKKNIRQLIMGKLVDAGLGAIAEEAIEAIKKSGVLRIN